MDLNKLMIDFLAEEGFRPHETEFGIAFKYEGFNFLYFKDDEDEQYFMNGYEMDVETLIDNEMIMSMPMKVLCKETCKGLCPVCGKNRNLGECGCDTFIPDPRMAAISDIFNAIKEV